MIIYKVWLTTAAIKILIDYSYTTYRRFSMNNTNKDVLTAALNDYLLHIQIDPLGDVTSQVNAIIALRDYILTNGYTEELIKSNLSIIIPAIKHHRKTLKDNIDHARLTGNEAELSKFLSEYNDLQPFIALTKHFEKFL